MKKLLLVLLTITILASCFGVFYLNKSNKGTQQIEVAKSKLFNIKSNVRAYPIVKEKTLYLYYFDKKQLLNTKIKVAWGSGEENLGENDPIATPDFKYTAYINEQTLKPIVLSNETLEKYEIDLNCKTQYLTTWTKDGSKLIFFCEQDSIDSRKSGMMTPWSGTEKFEKGLATGFYLFDIARSDLQSLYPIHQIIGAVDANRLLVTSSFMRERFVVFNLDTFELDYDLVKDSYDFGKNQFDFTQDGKYWVYTSGGPTTDKPVNIVYATFPNQNGVVLDTGSWAEVQLPKISPNGKYILYEKRTSVRGATPIETVFLYTATTKEKKPLAVQGWVEKWIENDGFVYSDRQSNNAIFYYDMATGTKTEMK
jgi:hypothetical protein